MAGSGCSSNVDITTVKAASNFIVVNDSSVPLHNHTNVISNATYWHKFIVSHAYDYPRDHILMTILDHVYPHDLIPVFFTKEKATKRVYFFARNCEPAIVKLHKDNLLVKNPLDKEKPFKLTILLRFTNTTEVKIDVSKNISKVLQKRLRPKTGTLNLHKFYKDPDLVEFCVLSQPKLLSFVLHLSRLFKYSHIILSNNDIQTLAPLETIWNSTVTSLDLRNNKLMSFLDLEPLRKTNITELWLEGNPLCKKYDEHVYIQTVKSYCPKIKNLDDVVLPTNGYPRYRRNYLCSSSGHGLVDQFMEHYFTLYDSTNRARLKDLYHKNATFSLTAQYQPGQTTSSSAELSTYMMNARNLKALVDLSLVHVNLKMGNQAIVDLFSTLPRTEHDPYSFTVDLVHHTDSYSVVTITGVFREVPKYPLDDQRYLGFSRSFVLHPTDGAYCIVNDQLHVYNALTSQQAKAFAQEKPVKCPMKAENTKQKAQLIHAMKLITNLKSEWARRCLEDSLYDLNKAIALFIDLYKADKIPPDGFQV